MNSERELSEIEIRVLGCLIEKEATTPDQYPLTLNALRNASNQKTNRFPVSQYEPGEIGHAIRELEGIGLVREVHGARVARYEHRFAQKLELHLADVAVLCSLMLRGPLTLAAIRSQSHRLHAFDDLDDVSYVIERLSQRQLVVQVPRSPGQKEDRYCHLLSGQPDFDKLPAAAPASVSRPGLEQRIAALETEVTELRDALEQLRHHLPNG